MHLQKTKIKFTFKKNMCNMEQLQYVGEIQLS